MTILGHRLRKALKSSLSLMGREIDIGFAYSTLFRPEQRLLGKSEKKFGSQEIAFSLGN